MKYKLIINLPNWFRGKGDDQSRLILKGQLKELIPQMCCLGFYGLACGVPKDVMMGEGGPTSTKTLANLFLKTHGAWLIGSAVTDSYAVDTIAYFHSSADGGSLMDANDDKTISEEVRQKRIKEIFALHDVEVEFVDTPMTETPQLIPIVCQSAQ